MRAYYATKLSPNISRMPNGFLVCKNVPIARTGTQEYQGAELEIADRPDEMFPVHREESEVFDPAALASFEGVPLVDEHPQNDVTVENACNLMRGFVKDVRRGDGEDVDKMMADIIITDPTVISEIENGKREVSCGYKCDYETDADGRICQRNIRGNHVALVYKGRAGQDVAIQDAKPTLPAPKLERRFMFMNKAQSKEKITGGILAKLLGITNADADPAVVAELAEHLLNAPGEGGPPADETPTPPATQAETTPPSNPPASKDEPPADELTAPPAWATQILERLGKLEAALTPIAANADPLDELEKEIAAGEEKVTKPVEQMDESDGQADGEAALDVGDTSDTGDTTDTGDAADANDEPPAPVAVDGTTDARDAIANAKKAVATIKDAATRRSVSDSMAGLIRQMYGIKPTTPKGSYGAILTAKQGNAKQMNDAYPAFGDMESRQAAYDKRNPHKKV